MPLQRKNVNARCRSASAPEPLTENNVSTSTSKRSRSASQPAASEKPSNADSHGSSTWRLYYGNNSANFGEGLTAHAIEAGTAAEPGTYPKFWTDSDAHLDQTLTEFSEHVLSGMDPWRACGAVGRNFRLKKIESDSHFGGNNMWEIRLSKKWRVMINIDKKLHRVYITGVARSDAKH